MRITISLLWEETFMFGRRYKTELCHVQVVDLTYLFQKIHYILSRFRVRPEDGPPDSPTPSEFIRCKLTIHFHSHDQ